MLTYHNIFIFPCGSVRSVVPTGPSVSIYEGTPKQINPARCWRLQLLVVRVVGTLTAKLITDNRQPLPTNTCRAGLPQ